ncbi:hypothetical protein BH11MYX3_BH11MYX3_16660 [soil metagenome]
MRRNRGRALVCLWTALTLLLPGCHTPPRAAATRPAPPPAPIATPPISAVPSTGRPEIQIDATASAGSLTQATPDQRASASTAQVSTLSPTETAALIARLEPLPDLSAQNAKAPTVRPASLPPPRAGAVQPIAFVVPIGKPVTDAPLGAPRATPPPPLLAPTILPVGDIHADAEIRIRFAEAMVPVAQVGTQGALPITITPVIAGTWKWIDTRVAAFVSTEARFPKATEVKITVPAGIKALSGSTLVEPVSGGFSTPPVNITRVWPSEVRPASPILVQLDQKIDPPKLLPFARIITGKNRVLPSRPIGLDEARPLWAKNPNLNLSDKLLADLGPNFVILAPQTSWPPGIQAQAMLTRGAPSAEGPRITTLERFGAFRVVPRFEGLGITCDDRETASMTAAICSAKGYLSVQFASPIQQSTYRAQNVQIAGRTFDDNAPSGGTITLETPPLPGQAHTITVLGSFSDIYGQPLVGARGIAFTTTLERFDPEINVRNGLYVIDPRFEIPQWVIYTQAVSQVRVQLFAVQPADFFAYQTFEAGKRTTPPGKRISDRTYAVGARMGADLRVDLRPALAKAGTGHVIAIATVTPSVRVPQWFNRKSIAWIQVSRLGLSARIDGERLSAFASDISPEHFLSPVPNLTTQLLVEGRPGVVATTTDNATGHAELALPPRQEKPKTRTNPNDDGSTPQAIVVMQTGADSVFTSIYGYERAIRHDNALWYVTDDRFTYKPGEPLYVKGWVRWTNDGVNPDLALPKPGEDITYQLNDPRGNKLASGTAPLTDQGGFDLEIQLPPTANLGTSSLRLSTRGNSHSHPISIQEFRTPAYAVTLDDDVGHSGAIPLILGESIEMNAVAKYYAGGGLPGADIRWDARLSATHFQPAGWDLFKFEPLRSRSDRYYSWRSSRYDDVGTVTEHQEGSLSGSSNASIVYGLAALPAGRTSLLEVDSTVTDIDRMNIRSSSRPILVHPSAYYVGIRQRAETYDKLELIVTDLDGKPVKGVPIKIEMEGVLGSERGRDDAKVIETQACNLVSDTTAVVCAWTRKDLQTAYTATARIADARGRVNLTQYDIPWFTWDDRRDLSIVPDRAHYKPGDVAKLEIKSKVIPSIAVVSFARQGLISQKRIELTQASTMIELPIEPAFVQNVHVSVDRWGKRKGVAAGSTLPLPEHESAQIELPVDIDGARLVMTTRPTAALVEPGANATFEVTVQHEEKPVANAEVALIVVDEAILSLSERKHGDPLLPFYREVSAGTSNAATFDMVEDAGPQLAGAPGFKRYRLDDSLLRRGSGTGSGYGVGGGRGGMSGRTSAVPTVSIVESRKDFRATAVFSPRLHTDAAGKVSVTVKMPDSLTRFRIVALATANNRWFGKAENVIVAQRKINARTVAPRFLTQGDAFSLPVVVQNLDASPRTIDVAVRAANLVQTGPAGKRVTVPPGQRAEVRFELATQGRGTVAIQTIATSGNFADATTVQLPVYEPATTESFATYGTVDDAPKFEQLAVPAAIFPDVGGVELEIASTQLQSLVDAYWYLYRYPYECAEQRSSRMLATAAMYDVLEAFGRTGGPDRKEIDQQLAKDVKRLFKDQRPDGGWGYFGGMESDPYVTMQVLSALSAQKAKGAGVQSAITYVTRYADAKLAILAKSVKQSAVERLDRAQLPAVVSLSAAALSSLASAGVEIPSRAATLHAAAVTLEAYPVDAKARILAMIATNGRMKPARIKLVADLLAVIHETASTATVTATYAESERLLLVSETKTTALVLDALIRATPGQPLITKLARGVLDARRGGRWRSTQENLVVLQAMRRYFDAYEKDTPSFTGKLWFGTAAYAEESFVGRSTKRGTARLDWTTLVPGSTTDLSLVKTGTGRMHYRVGITYAPKQTDLPALDAGFVVRRSYTAVDDPGDVQKLADGRWKVKLGARVLVTIEALNTTLRHAVALVDPLPAGFEAVNTNLATAERAAAGTTTNHWDYQNMRDNRAEVFSMQLREGTHTFAYTVRATTPGVFLAAPAKAEEMYSPETFGRSTGQTVIVE